MIRDLPWLETQKAQVRGAWDSQRLAPALLIHEARGAGGEWLALWIAQLVLCTAAAAAPCGECAACRRVRRGSTRISPCCAARGDSTQIRIEQVRELSAELSLTSHHGGYKVAIVAPADALNRIAANAFLKTLEEPTAAHPAHSGCDPAVAAAGDDPLPLPASQRACALARAGARVAAVPARAVPTGGGARHPR